MYPSLIDRTKALLIDGIILIALIIITSDILSYFQNIPNFLKMTLFILYFILYEPLLVSIKGATLGHNFAGIKVKNHIDQNKNISFHFLRDL